MMEYIGIVTNDSSNREEILAVISPEDYHLSSIENRKMNLAHLDGVIVYFNNENWLSETINWILLLRKEPMLFIFVLLPDEELQSKLICFQLGANYVLTFPKEQQFIPYIIANTFSFISDYYQQTRIETDFTLVENDLMLIAGKQEKALTHREYQVLSKLVEKKDKTVSYEEFAQKLWPEKNFTDPYEMRSYIANIMFHLREKISGCQWSIQTTRDKGYRLYKNVDDNT